MFDTAKGQLLVVVFRFLSLLPVPVLRSLGAAAGWALWISGSRARRTAETNLSLCFPQVSMQERQQLVRRTLQEAGKTACEAARIWNQPYAKTEQSIRRISGLKYLDAARQKKNGVIILAPHHGNWEMVGLFCASLAPMTSMYAPAKLPALDALMLRGRTCNGAALVPANVHGVRALLKALRAGEMIGILPDQVPEPESGVFAPFFGQPAFTMTLINTLAARTGAAVISCYAKRLDAEGGFEICLRPAADGIASEDIQQAALALNASVEECVRDCPEQYQWIYKRFRKQPDGRRLYR